MGIAEAKWRLRPPLLEKHLTGHPSLQAVHPVLQTRRYLNIPQDQLPSLILVQIELEMHIIFEQDDKAANQRNAGYSTLASTFCSAPSVNPSYHMSMMQKLQLTEVRRLDSAGDCESDDLLSLQHGT